MPQNIDKHLKPPSQEIKEEDVLRRMLATPPTPHKPKPVTKKKKTGK